MIVDGVERWKDGDVAQVADAMKALDAETLTVAFFGREEGRHKVPAPLRKAVEAAGGQVAEESDGQGARRCRAGSSRAPASSGSSSTPRRRAR